MFSLRADLPQFQITALLVPNQKQTAMSLCLCLHQLHRALSILLDFLCTSRLGPQLIANPILQPLSISTSPVPHSWGSTQRSVLPSARAPVTGTRWTLLLAHAGVTHDSTHSQIIRPPPSASCLQFLLWERHRQLI